MTGEEKADDASPGMDVSELRRPFGGAALERGDLDDDPVRQFSAWFEQACSSDALDPNAMSLSTVNANGQPSLRTVLLKYFDERGFAFFTNQSSTKATEMQGNPHVALLFFWRESARQVVIRGTAEKLPAAETMRYFLSRPRGSQLGAWVSPQSSVISSRALLEAKFDEMKRKFAKPGGALAIVLGRLSRGPGGTLNSGRVARTGCMIDFFIACRTANGLLSDWHHDR